MTKAQLRSITNSLITEAAKRMRNNIEKAIASGCMEIKGAEDNYILPKTLTLALLEKETREFRPPSQCERKVKKEARNISRFI